jgi:hypothetical protein
MIWDLVIGFFAAALAIFLLLQKVPSPLSQGHGQGGESFPAAHPACPMPGAIPGFPELVFTLAGISVKVKMRLSQ